MPINASAVGAETEPYDIDVTARRCLAYAAGLGLTNDVYFDDAGPGGIIASPAMVVAMEWPASRDIRETATFGATPEERIRTVHAQQDTQFHRPIRPGDRLRATGRIVTVKRIKPGAMTVLRLELADDTGAPVATTFTTGIYRGVEIAGADQVAETAPDWPEMAASGEQAETALPIAREMPHVYSECADIWNPIHTECAVALAAGLPDIILHGTATWALALQTVIDAHADGDPARLARFSGRFTGMVIPGTEIRVRHAAASGADGGAVFDVLNAEGAVAISDGKALLRD